MKEAELTEAAETEISQEEFKQTVLNDFRIANESRQASLLGRREVLTGKAKFGIFGDGKEVAQIAMAKVFRKGDIRAGYYRDQTFMMAAGLLTLEEFFAQLYAHADTTAEPSSAGRSMNSHFATRMLDENGQWKKQVESKQSSADISPTAGQMPRMLGLALASAKYRNNKNLKNNPGFSNNGDEVVFGTIGDASTSEGIFFEAMNAAAVLQVPMAISIWDDGYGISVPKKYQTVKQSISKALKGFQKDKDHPGLNILSCSGWDYPGLCEMYEKGIAIAREKHEPVLFHVQQMTQPQGHSTSGSHERYKSKDRLAWEDEFDCIRKLREFIIEQGIANEKEVAEIEEEAKKSAREAKTNAWKAFTGAIKNELKEATELIDKLASESPNGSFIKPVSNDLKQAMDPLRNDVIAAVRKALHLARGEDNAARNELLNWYNAEKEKNTDRYNSHLWSASDQSPLNIEAVKPEYNEDTKMVDGREVLRDNFDKLFEQNPLIYAFGEDLGKIGGVNQGFEGLQAKHGEDRIFDTGIREATIIGQGIGMALRGLRPIAEIQYLDYLLYALQIMSDDLATLQYRTKGGQKAPLIIRTRGHRLEGIWHSGSPMGMIIHALRGIHVLVPRNMTQAAGFYNTMLDADDPALIIEPLNGYRIKEKLPENLVQFKTPVGIPEVLREGEDVTIVTYGSLCRIALEAAKQLQELDVDVEIIDVQSLLPFDVNHSIVESLKKTNRVLFLDEDVPGGASAYMMQEVLENQGGYFHLDSKPKTLTSKAHRPAYGSDGDYFSKPNAEDIVESVYALMHEADPVSYPAIF